MINRESWKVHAMFRCEVCNWEDQDYRTAVTAARRHADKYGHPVRGETGYAVEYIPSSDHFVKPK